MADRARLVAHRLLRVVDVDGAYANLALPDLITQYGLAGRDAALATELGYGTLRAQGTLDAVIGACVDRPMIEIQPSVLDLLRLGTYQALRTRIPAHAAVASTVELARSTGDGRASGFVNAVLRKVVAADWDSWTARLGAGGSRTRRLALRTAHPEWIVAAFAAGLGLSGAGLAGAGGDVDELETALLADDERPVTHLVAWPGRSEVGELVAAAGGAPGPWSPYSVRLAGGDPAALAAVRSRRAAVQDEGSQLCALAFAAAPLEGRDERWLDLCAGPGGKTALLAALAAQRGAVVTANELRPHRAELVRSATAFWSVQVQVGDAREFAQVDGGFDRVLVDAPCTGLGALRRRPEARWRRSADDVGPLAGLQRQLLSAALRLVRPGGVVAYVTCSPHPAETTEVVATASGIAGQLDAPGVLRSIAPELPGLGDRPSAQLWPHRHGTDAMFCALLRR